MSAQFGATPIIIRTERGLTIEGTRITLYDLMDYLVAGWTPKLIRERLDLTEGQVAAAMGYIEANRAEVEAEYQIALQTAEENRQYWEDRNRERFAQIAAMPSRPGQEVIKEKLRAWKVKIASMQRAATP